jgi:hypothetical protein
LIAALALVAPSAMACHSTRTVHPDALASLADAPAEGGRDELFVRDAEGHDTLVEPMSSVTLFFRNGAARGPLLAGELCVSQTGVGTRTHGYALMTPPGCDAVWKWSDVAYAEIRTFHGAPSAPLLVVGSVVVVGAVVVNALLAPKDERERRSELAEETYETSKARVRAGETPRAETPSSEIAPDARALFSSGAARRSPLLFGAALEGGACASVSRPCATSAAWAHLRLLRFAELRVGARQMYASGVVEGLHIGPSVGARFHGELLPRRRVGFELGFEGTVGSTSMLHARWGIRGRIADATWLGIYPFNYAFTNAPGSSGSSWPSSLELVQDF